MGGLLSDKIGRRPVLVGITTLAIFTSYPVLSWLVSDISFSNLLITLAYFRSFWYVQRHYGRNACRSDAKTCTYRWLLFSI